MSFGSIVAPVDGVRRRRIRRTAVLFSSLLALGLLLGASPALAHHISGKVKCDTDHDGKFDGDDTALANIVVRVTSQVANPGQTFTDTTNASGFYQIDLPGRSDTYLVEVINLPAGFSVVLPNGGTHTVVIVTNTANDHKDGVDFLLQGCKPTTTTTTKPTTTTTSSTSTSSSSSSTSSSSSSTSTSSSSSSTSTSSSSSSTSTSTSSTTSTTIPIDHFQCYEVKPASFPATLLTLEDRFGTSNVILRYPHRLCAPADKNGEGMIDPAEHLVGYETLRNDFANRTEVVKNQFGQIALDLTRRDVLMAPGSKSLVGPAQPLQDSDVDHFQCYRARTSRTGPKFNKVTVTVVDQFETVTLSLTRPYRLCVPTNKEDEDPTAPDHPTDLLCYRTRSISTFGTLDVNVNTQFGPDELRLIHRRELCVPSSRVKTTE